MNYRVVEVPFGAQAVESVFNAQLAEGYQFVAWLVIPSGSNSGLGIFFNSSNA